MMETYNIFGFKEVSGKADEFHIDHRIFNAAAFCSSAIGAFYLTLNFLQGSDNLRFTSFFIIFFLVNFTTYVISRFKKVRSQKLRLVFLCTTIIALVLGLVINNGILGVIPFYFILAFMTYLTVFKMRYHILISVLMFGIIISVGFLQINNPIIFSEFVSIEKKQIWARIISILVTMFFSLGLVNYLRMNYSLEKRKVLEANKELAISQINTQKAMEIAVEASKVKAEFLSTMSHEIRTPMNAVIGMTHLLIQESTNKEQLENLHTLKFSAENLLALINDILDFSKIEAGKIAFEEVEFSLKDLVRSVREALKVKAHDKGIELLTHLDENLPETIKSDPTRLTQILNNLVGNAVKFTQKGFVTLDIKAKTITENSAEIEFKIIDTGIGIPKDKHEHIFEKFSQASNSTTREFGGTGLGLSITKRLIELQNSHIEIESELGKGTTFSFVLNMKIGENNMRKSLVNVDRQMFSSLNGLKVLLVDDNKTNILIASKFLRKWDIDVVAAFDGKQAFEYVKNDFFNLVLMDIQMPTLDGIGATKLIRKLPDPIKSSIPIIALTASAMLDERAEILASGMNDFVSKPFNPMDLFKKIVEHSKMATNAA